MMHTGGKKFSTDEEVKGEFDNCGKEVVGEFIEVGIKKKSIPRLTTCIERDGDYVGEKKTYTYTIVST